MSRHVVAREEADRRARMAPEVRFWLSTLGLLIPLLLSHRASAQGGSPDEAPAPPSPILSPPTPTEAPPTAARDEEEVRVHLRLARVYFDSGRFEAAAQEFQYAYELSNDPAILRDLYLAHRNAGDVDRAVAALELYLEREPDAPDRPQLEARLANLRRLAEEQARARAEDREVPALEPPPPDEQPPPLVEPEPEPPTTPTPPPAAEEPIGVRIAPWLVMGAGGAMLAGSIATGLLALRAERRLESRCTPGEGGRYVCAYAGFEDDRRRGQTLATATDVLIITGAIFVSAGFALLFLLDQPGRGEAPILDGFRADAGCSRYGCTVDLRKAF